MTTLVLAAAAWLSAADEQQQNQKPNPAAVHAAPSAAALSDATGEYPAADWLNVETVTLAAANGDPLAQLTPARLTEKGTSNMPAGREAAARLYAAALPGLQRAADRGNRGACMVPAAMYAHGKGVEADVKKAARYASKVQCKGLAPCDSNQTKSCGNKACGKPSGVKSHAGKCCTPTQSCAPKLPLEAPAPKA